MKHILLFCFASLLFTPAWSQADKGTLLQRLALPATDSLKVARYTEVAASYAKVNPDSANYYAELGLEYAIRQKYANGEAEMLLQLAILDKSQGRVDLAKERLTRAMNLFTHQNNELGKASVYQNMGMLEAGKGNGVDAVKYYVDAVRIFDKLGDSTGMMQTYRSIGSIYIQMIDSVESIKYLLLAKGIADKLPLSNASISLNSTIGVYHAAKGNLAKAQEYFQNSLAWSNKPEFAQSHVEAIIFLATYYDNLGKMDLALPLLEEGLAIARANNFAEEESNLLLELAFLHKRKDPNKSLAYLADALVICRKMHNLPFAVNIYTEITDIYKQTGKYKEAFEAQETKQALRDSMYNINKAKEIASITAIYELDKSNEKVRDLENQNYANTRVRNILIAVSLVIIIALLVLLFFYRKILTLNRRLVEHEKELMESNSMKDKLFSIIGHDLRGPIGRVPAIIDIYEDPETPVEEKKYLLHSLKEHSLLSLETLDKLLYWGQSLIKGITLQQQRFEAVKYTTVNVDLKKVSAHEKQITIKDHTPAGLYIFADPTHFDFVVRNLLSNAVKYTRPQGAIRIEADSAAKPGMVVFAIADNGIGIEATAIGHIFSTTRSIAGTANEKGTGLGLMLCREFILQNGGEIWVESTLGAGTTFYFSLKSA